MDNLKFQVLYLDEVHKENQNNMIEKSNCHYDGVDTLCVHIMINVYGREKN